MKPNLLPFKPDTHAVLPSKVDPTIPQGNCKSIFINTLEESGPQRPMHLDRGSQYPPRDQFEHKPVCRSHFVLSSFRTFVLTLLLCVYMSIPPLLTGCDTLPGRPAEADRPLRPADVKDFSRLYSENCSGCHGADGRFGAALALNNPVYLALVDDAALRRVIAGGVPGTSAPPFARSAGGLLTDEQIDILINGMRMQWAQPDALAGAGLPPYAADGSGDAHGGAAVYDAACRSCHGADGTGTHSLGSIVDPAFLTLVSNQALRTLIIAGRPDLRHPDWRSYPVGQPLTAQQVSDVVAWLAARRPAAHQPAEEPAPGARDS